PEWQSRLDSPSVSSPDESLIEPVRIDFGKRMVAGVIDFFCAYGVNVVVGLIPLINQIISFQLVMVLILIVRDWLYEGRGIGKNLMGLQVVDVRTGQPCTLIQSIKRNIIMFGPPFVLYIVITVLNIMRLFKLPGVTMISGIGMDVINNLGFLYLLIVIPSEAYRAYNRPDGRRLGDEFAGTTIVEAPMDFGAPFPRQ